LAAGPLVAVVLGLEVVGPVLDWMNEFSVGGAGRKVLKTCPGGRRAEWFIFAAPRAGREDDDPHIKPASLSRSSGGSRHAGSAAKDRDDTNQKASSRVPMTTRTC